MTAITKAHGQPFAGFTINVSQSQSTEQAVFAETKPPQATEPSPEQAKTNSTAGPTGLTERELKLVQELKKVDSEVRAHELAHIAAGGQFVRSGANLKYLRGPDGKNYAVAGEVSIDSSPVPGNPRATMDKMRRIQAAALAPASPSSQDRKVAAKAAALAAKASAELIMLRATDGTHSIKKSTATPFGKAIIAYSALEDDAIQRGTFLNTSA